jgi:hypothetical protein
MRTGRPWRAGLSKRAGAGWRRPGRSARCGATQGPSCRHRTGPRRPRAPLRDSAARSARRRIRSTTCGRRSTSRKDNPAMAGSLAEKEARFEAEGLALLNLVVQAIRDRSPSAGARLRKYSEQLQSSATSPRLANPKSAEHRACEPALASDTVCHHRTSLVAQDRLQPASFRPFRPFRAGIGVARKLPHVQDRP